MNLSKYALVTTDDRTNLKALRTFLEEWVGSDDDLTQQDQEDTVAPFLRTIENILDQTIEQEEAHHAH